jgi:hypothetical protein
MSYLFEHKYVLGFLTLVLPGLTAFLIWSIIRALRSRPRRKY